MSVALCSAVVTHRDPDDLCTIVELIDYPLIGASLDADCCDCGSTADEDLILHLLHVVATATNRLKHLCEHRLKIR